MHNSMGRAIRLPRGAGRMPAAKVLAMVTAVALGGWAANATAQVANSPLFQSASSAVPATAPGWPARQGVQSGSSGMAAIYPAPYSGGNAGMYPSMQPPVSPGLYPADRTPALRDLTQRPASPLENAARDAGVRQQVYSAPPAAPRYP